MTELTENLVVTVKEINKLFGTQDTKTIFDNINSSIKGSSTLFDNLNNQIIPLAESTQKSLNRLEHLLSNTETQLTAALTELLDLTKNLNQQMSVFTKSGVKAFDMTEQAFTNVNHIVDEQSVTRIQLEKTLNELSRAAKSMRVFSEYLEQHPEALLKGKGKNY